MGAYAKGSILLLDPDHSATWTDFQWLTLPLVSRYSLLIVGSWGGAHDAPFTPLWQLVAAHAKLVESVAATAQVGRVCVPCTQS